VRRPNNSGIPDEEKTKHSYSEAMSRCSLAMPGLTVSGHRILTSLIHDNQAFAPQHRPYRHLIPSGVEAEDRLGHTSQLFARHYGRLGVVQHNGIRRVEDEIISDRPNEGSGL
jgi:hypothetical protein